MRPIWRRKELPRVRGALRGWTFVTDDGVSLARRSSERLVVGTPRGIHFRPTAVEVLPALEGHLIPIQPWGKLSFKPVANAFPEFRRAVHANINAVVFLNRDAGGNARLVKMSSEEAFSRLDRELPLMEQIEDQRLSLRGLVEGRSYELRYSDLYDAVKHSGVAGLMKSCIYTILAFATAVGTGYAQVASATLLGETTPSWLVR